MPQTQTAKPTPTPPSARGVAGAPVVAGATTAPVTAQDVEALKARRSELSDQLISASGRREALAAQLKTTTDPALKTGLEQRISVLDNRIVRLELDIGETGDQLSSAPAALIATTEVPGGFMGLEHNDVARLSLAFMFLVMLPLAIGAARMMWKRSSRPAPQPPAIAQSAERLARMEQSMDAIAVEVERISEGQRFVTRLLSEQKQPVLPGGDRPG